MDISEKVRLEEGFWFSPQADYIVFLTINSTKVICNLKQFSLFQGKPAKNGFHYAIIHFQWFPFYVPQLCLFFHWIALSTLQRRQECSHQSMLPPSMLPPINVATNPAFNQSENSCGYNYYKPFTHDFTYMTNF